VEVAAKKDHWIQGAIKHPGALKEKAAKAGGIDKKTGKIKESFLEKAAKAPGKLGKEARLAETLKGMHHKKR
jgi:hypothetical protein